MFTGLIECQGVVTRVDRVSGGVQLDVYAPEFGRDMQIGDSISLDGACLTVAKFMRGAFLADVSAETLARTTLGGLRQGSAVNLERAMRLSDRFGGHFVSGHVDGVGSILMRQPSGNSTVYRFRAPEAVMPYLVPKGSAAVDGISLTIAEVMPDGFTAAIVPHTEETTTLKGKPIGAPVNMEADMIAKYVTTVVARYTGAPLDVVTPKRGGRLSDMLRDLAEGT